MTVMELATASQYNIGVKVLVLNNEFQGMVLQWQYLIYDARYSHTRMTNPDFVLLAEAMWCTIWTACASRQSQARAAHRAVRAANGASCTFVQDVPGLGCLPLHTNEGMTGVWGVSGL
ncbi:thiamine diphosphate-binding protein [Mycena olivaceomarginata]|nr:thiamine diphosphate-binding protein [Mycena olivaceomarginata]